MAIDRKDYQYIHNSLGKNSVASNDNSLKIGSKVKNLLVELKEENIWNADFPDYYGSKPPECWESYSKTKKPISVTAKGTYIESKSEPVSQKTTTIVAPGKGGLGFSDIDGSTSSSTIKTVIYYQLVYTHTVGSREQVTDIMVENMDKSTTLPSAKYEWLSDTSTTIKCYFYSTSKTVFGNLRYNIQQSDTEDKTVETGVLYYTTIIKPKTTYVLQVVNAVLPANTSIENRNIITLIPNSNNNTKRLINFDQYVFFETGEDETIINLEIQGLSYGYQIYGLAGEKVYELRCIKTNTQAKVFLFESKYPWMVDNKGIVTNLAEAYLKIKQKSSNIPIQASLNAEQLESLFKEAPSFYILHKRINNRSTSTLTIPLPNSVLENREWKWKTGALWKYVGENTSYPKIMDNIYLLVYRNFLTEEIRDYNNIKTTTQYGLLRTIQKTTANNKDEYAQKINYSIQLNQKPLLGISPNAVKQQDNTFEWNFLPISFNIPIDSLTIEKRTDINLYILPLLGYNYTHSVINNKDDIYKYTAFSVAWGKKEGNEFIRLSDFSIPIIVDRSAIQIENSSDNTKYILTPKSNLKLTLKDSTDYYPFSAIYLEQVAETTKAINE